MLLSWSCMQELCDVQKWHSNTQKHGKTYSKRYCGSKWHWNWPLTLVAVFRTLQQHITVSGIRLLLGRGCVYVPLGYGAWSFRAWNWCSHLCLFFRTDLMAHLRCPLFGYHSHPYLQRQTPVGLKDLCLETPMTLSPVRRHHFKKGRGILALTGNPLCIQFSISTILQEALPLQ